MINTDNINEARKAIIKAKKPVVVLSQTDEFNRKILENKDVDVLVLNESLSKKDYLKQRASQLNEVFCKLAAKNNIKIGVDLAAIMKKTDVEKAKSLARLSQNISLCKRTGADLVFLGKADKRSLSSLFLTLGASTSQAKKAAQESF